MLDLLQPAEDQISDSGVVSHASASPSVPVVPAVVSAALGMAHNYPLNVPPTVNGYSTSSGLSFPHTAPQLSTAPSWMFRTPSLFSQASVHATGSFQFSNPTHSSPPIQMTAPGCQGTTSYTWQPSTSLNISWATSTSTSSTIEAPTQYVPSSVTNHNRDVILDRLRGIKTASDRGRRPKRKSSDSYQEVPGKVFVNEEKMAARMQGLTLDNNNLDWHPDLENTALRNQDNWFTQNAQGDRVSSSPSDSDEDTDDAGDEGASSSKHRNRNNADKHLPHLEISDMLEIGIRTKELLPKAILEEIHREAVRFNGGMICCRNKPNLQVVLWKPPGDFVKEVIREAHPSIMSDSTSMEDATLPDTSSPVVAPPQRKIAIVNPTVWAVPAGSTSTRTCDEELDSISSSPVPPHSFRPINGYHGNVQKPPLDGGEQMEL